MRPRDDGWDGEEVGKGDSDGSTLIITDFQCVSSFFSKFHIILRFVSADFR